MSTLWPGLISPIDSQGPHAPNAFNTALPVNDDATLMGDSYRSIKVLGDGGIDELPRLVTGFIRPSVNDTFYNRILIEPANLEMGNLLSNQTRNIQVWNGFLDSKELTNFLKTNDEGIFTNEPVDVPYTMRPLELLTYTLSVTTDGPPVIDAILTWVVGGIKYMARITGRRVVVWPFGPSWDSPLTESLQWLTNILRSFDGSEQRRSLRTKPRRTFSYQFKTAREQSARMENLLWGWQNRTYALPVWTDKTKLQQVTEAGATALQVVTSTFSFTTSNLAVIYGGPSLMEVVEVESIQPNALSLVRPTQLRWPKGAVVMPVVLGHLPTAVALMRLTSQAVVGSLTFTTNPTDTTGYIPAGTPDVVYDGLEVIMRQPNWVNGLDNTFEYLFDTLDQQTGPITWDTTEDTPRITRRYSWLLRNRTQVRDFRSMLGRLHGMQKTIRVPTWHDDFKITQLIGVADLSIHVAENDFRLMVGSDLARDRIMVRLTDGTTFFRRITGVSADDQGPILIIDEPFNREIQVNEVKAIHLVMKSRLATDQVDIVWRTDRVATVDTTFITVKD